jgi:hypothetical protein
MVRGSLLAARKVAPHGKALQRREEKCVCVCAMVADFVKY